MTLQYAIAALALSCTMIHATEQRAFPTEHSLAVHHEPIHDVTSTKKKLATKKKLTKDVLLHQLTQGMGHNDKAEVTRAIENMSPDYYTDAFSKIVDEFENMIGYHRVLIIICVAKVHPDRYADFINIVEILSRRMDRDDKRHIMHSVSYVHSDRYTGAFINTINQLMGWRDINEGSYNTSRIIGEVGRVDPNKYKDFIEIVDRIAPMGGGYNANVIGALAGIAPDRYTDAFIKIVDELSQEMYSSDEKKDNMRVLRCKSTVIYGLRNVPPDRYTGAFINTVNHLWWLIKVAPERYTFNYPEQEAIDYRKGEIINAVGKVHPDRYTDEFVNVCKELSQGIMYYNSKISIIEEVGKVDPNKYKFFIKAADQLAQGLDYYRAGANMDLERKAIVIRTLANINQDLYTEAFVNVVYEFSKKMNGSDKECVIRAVEKINPDRYTDFVNTVNQLSQGLESKKYVIIAVGNINPDRYTDAFINTINQLSNDFYSWNRSELIEAVEKINPDRYTDAFVNVCKELFQGMEYQRKLDIVMAIGKVTPDRYADFINTVNYLSQGMDADNKSSVIVAVGKVQPELYAFLQNFIEQNPRYFRYVLTREFEQSILPNMTQPQLQELLQRLHRQYRHRAPAGTPQALAFEIHNFARQEVVGETGQRQPFNEAVLGHIRRSIQGRVLDYEIVLDLLRSELNTLMRDKKKSDAINDAVFNWVIQRNEEEQDKNVMTLVVTYLEQKDHTHKKLATWLYAFMDESKKAYDGMISGSCAKGVKERVITSLRSAIPEGDVVLENLFHQAEASLMTATKSKKLMDYAFWAQKLQTEGVTSTTSQDVAKDKFSHVLKDYFEGVTDASVSATINATLETFDDSESDSDSGDTSLRLTSDGLWSKIKAELLKLEQGGEQPEPAAQPECAE
ncbi:MAG: hypothetical protein NEHIOOID_00229 [Holosporales bacterium]